MRLRSLRCRTDGIWWWKAERRDDNETSDQERDGYQSG